jgi:hypothetical protein
MRVLFWEFRKVWTIRAAKLLSKDEAQRIAANDLSIHMANIDIALRCRRYRFWVGRKAPAPP